MNILSFKDEQLLSTKQRLYYYEQLKDYLLGTPHEHLTRGSLSICPVINPIISGVLKKTCGYKIYVDGEDVHNIVGIYANTHQDKYDHVNFVVSNPNHTILLNSSVLSPIYKIVLNMNGVIYVDKNSKEDKNISKLEMLRLLYGGKGITMFPESAWNLSPNKLHLPLYIGMVDMARKTGLPIIPVVQEYEYINKNDSREHIDYVCVRYGKPIYVNPTDDLFDKLNEVSEVFATMRWNLIEKKGMKNRKDINNDEYINFIKASIRNLKNAGIDVDVEQKHIYGADDPFYLFHHLNRVEFDENGNFIETKHVRKLAKMLTQR